MPLFNGAGGEGGIRTPSSGIQQNKHLTAAGPASPTTPAVWPGAGGLRQQLAGADLSEIEDAPLKDGHVSRRQKLPAAAAYRCSH
jgi:hypothetical protein